MAFAKKCRKLKIFLQVSTGKTYHPMYIAKKRHHIPYLVKEESDVIMRENKIHDDMLKCSLCEWPKARENNGEAI